MLYKCIKANTSAIWQHAAHTADQRTGSYIKIKTQTNKQKMYVLSTTWEVFTKLTCIYETAMKLQGGGAKNICCNYGMMMSHSCFFNRPAVVGIRIGFHCNKNPWTK